MAGEHGHMWQLAWQATTKSPSMDNAPTEMGFWGCRPQLEAGLSEQDTGNYQTLWELTDMAGSSARSQ